MWIPSPPLTSAHFTYGRYIKEMVIMIIENQMVMMKWSNRNKAYYSNLGYDGFENGKEFVVKISDLPSSTHAIIQVVCDFCGTEHSGKYASKVNNKNHFCSRKCQDSFLIGKPSWNSKKFLSECSNCKTSIERSEWELNRSDNLFCSRECSNQFKIGKGVKQVERFIVYCKYCDIKIERTQNELNRAKNHFCTKKCADSYMKGKSNVALINRMEVKCYLCSETMFMTPSRVSNTDRIFCSKECRKEWMSTDEYSQILYRDGLVDVLCDSCGEIFKKKRTTVTENNFCSRKCHGIQQAKKLTVNNPNPQKNKIKVNCYTCNSEKYVPESVHKKNKYFFCSHECYQQKRIEISDFRQTGTSIHRVINHLLDHLGIKHENEKGFSYYSLDIYIPSAKLGIEIMGDYWHSSPLRYELDSMLNDVQLKNISRDKRKNATITKRFNVPILYLWEHDINNRLSVCEKLICDFLTNKKLQDYHSFNYDNNGLLNENIILPYFKSSN